MSRRPIFIGPEYPPESVIQAIIGLTVNITDRSSIIGSIDVTNDAERISNYLTDMRVSKDGVSFSAVITNPLTGDIIRTTAGVLTTQVVLRPGTDLPTFNGGSARYEISPCCVILTYPESAEDSTNLQITCKSPLRSYVSDNRIMVEVDDTMNITPQHDANATDSGVLSINGLSTKNGGIIIRGAGAVSVTTTGANDGGSDG